MGGVAEGGLGEEGVRAVGEDGVGRDVGREFDDPDLELGREVVPVVPGRLFGRGFGRRGSWCWWLVEKLG